MINQQESKIFENTHIIELNEKNEERENNDQSSDNNPDNFNNQKTNQKSKKNKSTNLKVLNEDENSDSYSIEDRKLKLLFINKRKHEASNKFPNKNKKLKIIDTDTVNLDKIINISEFISNMNSKNQLTISNSDMILIILEICLNS